MDHEHAAVPAEFDLKQFFAEIKTIAVVGYSDKPDRAGHYVAHYLADSGYEVLAINPKFGDEVNGLTCYANLAAIPAGTHVDVIDVFRAPPFVPEVVAAVAGMEPRPKYIVMQPGAENPAASQLAREAGIVPLDLCMMAMHKVWAR
ncbi:CoA-binding protein [bacterium]|nr:CoA-binding protein [bacterium]